MCTTNSRTARLLGCNLLTVGPFSLDRLLNIYHSQSQCVELLGSVYVSYYHCSNSCTDKPDEIIEFPPSGQVLDVSNRRIEPPSTKAICSRFRGVVSTTPMTTSNVQHNSTSATFDIQPYKLHKLDKGPSQTSTITAEDAIKLYTDMQLCRRLEAVCATLYKEKVIRGFCHLYSGEEAIAVGVKAAMRPQDSVITAYRCHAWTFLMGVSAVGVIAELTGRKSGCARGKGGSMHMYGRNFYGGNGIVGGQVPLGTGIGLVHKYKGDGGICFTMYGDGAANQGQVFESFNISKLWALPMVYICENNKYGLGTAAARAAACTDYYTRGDYIPGIWVDGMDVLASMEATRYAIGWVTSGKGPIVLEMETYRYFGHSMSDPGTSYRSREEIQEVRKNRDPITNFREKILSKNLVTPEKIKELDASVRKHIDQAAVQSTTDPEIGLEELGADVYAEGIVSDVRGVRPDTPLRHLSIAKRQ